MKKKTIVFLVLLAIIVGVCILLVSTNKETSEGDCCTCLDCPQCDVCCSCSNPYLGN